MNPNQSKVRILGILVAILIIIIGVNWYLYHRLNGQLSFVKSDYDNKVADLQKQITLANDDKESLSSQLTEAKSANDDLQTRLEKITGKAATLTKLTQLDPQLLQKYSRVFFLNENYLPKKLYTIPDKYLRQPDPTHPEQYLSSAWPFLGKMLSDAETAGLNLKVESAYRSFQQQATLKSQYRVVYGAGSNQFSADQGYSEHQLGTTVDLTSTASGGSLEISFEQTPEFRWLKDNAYKYGFELSYPRGNTYYQYEPWHWRFVGRELAIFLHDENKNFYDLDQREINSYLVNIFNQ